MGQDAKALMYGSYTIEEVKTNDSYLLTEGQPITFTIKEDGKIVEAGTKEDQVERGLGAAQKYDRETDSTIPQGDATFEGIRFALYNESVNPVLYKGKEYAKGEQMDIFTTDTSGKWSTAQKSLPYGHYKVVELSLENDKTLANTHGMLFGNETREFNITDDGQVVNLKFTDPVVRGGVQVQKLEEIWQKAEAQGDGSLEGIRYTIKNMSKNRVLVGGKEYAPGADILTIKTDEKGIAKTAADLLPYGTYTIREIPTEDNAILANESHLYKEAEKTFVIRKNGEIVTTD